MIENQSMVNQFETNNVGVNDSVDDILAQATALLQISEPGAALQHVQNAFNLMEAKATAPSLTKLAALNLMGEIYIELGDLEMARDYFLRAIQLDPNGDQDASRGGGAEKFLWMAQICDKGGRESVEWFEKGVKILRACVARTPDCPANRELLGERKSQLAAALCGIAEVYMTDLACEDSDAEVKCEQAIAEALAIAPDNPEVLQTLASTRISQSRHAEAKVCLNQSIDLWKDLPVNSAKIPSFPVRISLVRLLIEVSEYDQAINVVNRLLMENDNSVEAWYLGGWSFWLKVKDIEMSDDITRQKQHLLMLRSKKYLKKCLRTYAKSDYEDEPLHEHVIEILGELDSVLARTPRMNDQSVSASAAGETLDIGDDNDDDDDDDDYMWESVDSDCVSED